jgi:hypothetical protein
MMSPAARASAILTLAGLALLRAPAARAAESLPHTRGNNPHYAWAGSYKAVIDQTAALVEGTVVEVQESYDEQEGPRTLVTLSDMSVQWGELSNPHVTLRLFGGHLPSGDLVQESHIPTFVRGRRYVVFLSNRDWRLTPVTADQAFIIERVHGKSLVVTTDGFAVSGIDEVEGIRRACPVYRIPNGIEDGFVPRVEQSVTREMVQGAYSDSEFAAEIRAFAARNDVAVSGSFVDQPYHSGRTWRTIPATRALPGTTTAASAPASDRPLREARPCGEHAMPIDSARADRSSMCPTGGVQ